MTEKRCRSTGCISGGLSGVGGQLRAVCSAGRSCEPDKSYINSDYKGRNAMKNFNREYTAFALCGLNCGLCPMYHMENPCPGCGGGEGNQSCAIARCSLEHGGPAHCSQCGEFPCARYEGLTGYDSFLSHRNMLRDLKRAGRDGISGLPGGAGGEDGDSAKAAASVQRRAAQDIFSAPRSICWNWRTRVQ